HLVRRDVAGAARQDHARAVLAEPGDACRREDLAVALPDVLGQALADLAIVDDARLGHVDRADASRVRLKLGEPVRVNDRTVDPIGLAAFEDPLQGRQLGLVDGDDYLAADLVGDPFRRAELLHRLLAGPAVDRLERTRFVVDPRVQHTRVVPG